MFVLTTKEKKNRNNKHKIIISKDSEKFLLTTKLEKEKPIKTNKSL